MIPLHVIELEFPDEGFVKRVFEEAVEELEVPGERVKDLVIYEMTDGMRTSSDLEGSDAYVDGGLFSLRLIHILKILGVKDCYINVIEQRHTSRVNYRSIYEGLLRLYSIYKEYAEAQDVRLVFLGDLDRKLEPEGVEGDFAGMLKELERATREKKSFTSYFLMNYSLDWAMGHGEVFKDLPSINVVIRHTKLQCPTGMLLPPSKSDYSSLVYVQQGSSHKTWTDSQLVCLVALALRSLVLNEGTQYLKSYREGERDMIRFMREERLFFKHENLFRIEGEEGRQGVKTKRAILAGPFGPELYDF